MQTLIGGQYNGCPINQLPTGYMVWSVENEKFKKHWSAFNIELKQRIELNAEPKINKRDLDKQNWFNDIEVKSQKQYTSMMTTGAWNWLPIKTKDLVAQNRLIEVMLKLNIMFPSAENNSDLFVEPKVDSQKLLDILKKDVPNDIELGQGETEDDITMEEANDILFQRLKTDKTTNAQVDEILAKLRTRNADQQLAQAYQAILNQLSHITSVIVEQEQQFTLWELRDVEWHLDTVKSRLYWLLRQREDY